MTGDNDKSSRPRGYASPPCFAHEIDPAYYNSADVDPQQVLDVSRWRQAERTRLLGERAALPVLVRQAAAETISVHLDAFLAERFIDLAGLTISAWWPIKAELDLRFWLAGLAERGARAALPLVVERAAPLAFRVWSPTTRMERGFWNIPVPAEGPEVKPDITLAPVVGWDDASYRLGYGGGYFDRTLAAYSTRPLAIGIGLQAARVASIFPQPHDIPMAATITETGAHWAQP
jgi:5-formyltetrahydrofolate cyclo-ligase